MNDQNHTNEEHPTSSTGERVQHHPAVMSKLQVWMKVLHWVFWICLAVTAFITLPFYYALGAVYAVPLVMVIVWAVWQMVRGKA
jgi:hypothetical protein